MISIALVTPLKNESSNIERLYNSLISQNGIVVALWVIVENDSTDDSAELLDKLHASGAIGELRVINLKAEDPSYVLGAKYSGIVNHGFNVICESNYADSIDFIGILDADCFPKPDYYAKLTEFMCSKPDCGIASGLISDEMGRLDLASTSWARGGCRLWKIKCFQECGYVVGPSADALSSAKAETRGWKSLVDKTAFVISRETGARSNYAYYGKSSYYRGTTLAYALIKSIYLTLKSPGKGYKFLKGYMEAYIKGEDRVDDEDIKIYYGKQLSRRLREIFR